MPRKLFSSLGFVGIGNVVIASVCSFEGFIPSDVIVCPRKSHEVAPNVHFEVASLRPDSSIEARTLCRSSRCCSLVGEKTRMSSK